MYKKFQNFKTFECTYKLLNFWELPMRSHVHSDTSQIDILHIYAMYF